MGVGVVGVVGGRSGWEKWVGEQIKGLVRPMRLAHQDYARICIAYWWAVVPRQKSHSSCRTRIFYS